MKREPRDPGLAEIDRWEQWFRNGWEEILREYPDRHFGRAEARGSERARERDHGGASRGVSRGDSAMSTVYDKTKFELAHARLRLAPIELSETDLEQLATVDPALETKGREAKREAQLAIVRQHTAPPLQTKSIKAAPPETLDEFVGRYGTKTVTWAGLTKVLSETDAVLVKAITALKQRCETLEARVLELEASAAARTVEHADR
jgi:hypothetical protein